MDFSNLKESEILMEKYYNIKKKILEKNKLFVELTFQWKLAKFQLLLKLNLVIT